ncbi:hypothetical protein N9850_09310 [Granulosicoccus sp.]|nr:hypothetical protein [Granulosicoccus sp.]
MSRLQTDNAAGNNQQLLRALCCGTYFYSRSPNCNIGNVAYTDRPAGHDNTDWCACEYFQQLPGSSFGEVVQEGTT